MFKTNRLANRSVVGVIEGRFTCGSLNPAIETEDVSHFVRRRRSSAASASVVISDSI